MTGSVTTHAKEINPSCSDCLLRADFKTRVIYKACAKVWDTCLWFFLFNQCCRQLPKNSDMINLWTSPASHSESMAEAQIHALNPPPSMFFSLCHMCLLITCLAIFRPSNFYASSLSEYFANKVEERKEIQKREEEEAAKVTPAPASCPPTPIPKQKKGGKPGFTSFNFNIFCNTDTDKGPKTHPVSCSEGLVTLS